ncbi:hypothetical protein B0H16DRAFT_1721982 [Mycena metata]|uniref:Uncharacterized protein n=1 Tax=Mycena metata TaxID=1033252 RepID=A0AAD7NDL7_9AGAR|nr:hypothetical protein B0H16DRAFT_1721982 [Mycena metata]
MSSAVPGVHRWTTASDLSFESILERVLVTKKVQHSNSPLHPSPRTPAPSTLHPPAIIMVSYRKAIPVHKSSIRTFNSRLYSTAHDTPSVAFTRVQMERLIPGFHGPHRKPVYRPLVEAHFPDVRQPHIHDFPVRLQHGAKVSRFRIFLKRGKVLTPNLVSNLISGDVVIMSVPSDDPDALVDLRDQDQLLADFVFLSSLNAIANFQSPQRTILPKELVALDITSPSRF